MSTFILHCVQHIKKTGHKTCRINSSNAFGLYYEGEIPNT